MLLHLELCKQRILPVFPLSIDWHAIMLIAAKWSRKLDFRKRPYESPLRAWIQHHHGCGAHRPSSAERNCKRFKAVIKISFATSTRPFYLHKGSCVTFCLISFLSSLARQSSLATSKTKPITRQQRPRQQRHSIEPVHSHCSKEQQQGKHSPTLLNQENSRSGCRSLAEQSAYCSG